MNGRNYNDFKMATVRPEPVEGCFFAKGASVSFFSALRLQVTGYLGSLDEAFEVAIPREINAPICCLVFCEHQVSSHRTG